MFLKKFMQRLGTVMVLSNLSKTLTQRAMVILAICLTSLACYLILKESGRLLQVLRQTGINVLTRLMGLLLAVVAIQFVIDGIKAVILEITSGR
jgi:multiple antibiotic resistance protein